MIELKEMWTGINLPKNKETVAPTDNSKLEKIIKEALKEVKILCEVIEFRFILSRE